MASYDTGGTMNFTNPTPENQNMINTVNTQFQPFENQLMANLKKRNLYGGDLYSPTAQAGVFSPMAANKSTALTDLWFKNEANKRAWNADTRANTLTDEQYGLSEMQMTSGSKKNMLGNKVICTELYRQGLLPLAHIKADLKFLKTVPGYIHDDYLRWATPLVYKMKNSKLLSLLIFIPVWFWSSYMMNSVKLRPLGIRGYVGKIIHLLGIKFGRWYARREEITCLS